MWVESHVNPDFNPRSREGSDYIVSYFHKKYNNFNPRSREGSDLQTLSCTHKIGHFNPRSREGSDDVEKVKGAQEELFQSTLPRGERRDGGLQK